jgi:hypothetical protein
MLFSELSEVEKQRRFFKQNIWRITDIYKILFEEYNFSLVHGKNSAMLYKDGELILCTNRFKDVRCKKLEDYLFNEYKKNKIGKFKND